MAQPDDERAERAAPPILSTELEPLGAAELAAVTLIGDPGTALITLDTRPGRWLGYVWRLHGVPRIAQLIAIHADHLAGWQALLASASSAGQASTNRGQAMIYAERTARVPQHVFALDQELDNPAIPGLIGDRGFSLWLGGDGLYPVAASVIDGHVVCIQTGDPLDPLVDELLRGAELEPACVSALVAWRTARRPTRATTNAALTALELLVGRPATDPVLAELTRVAGARADHDDVATAAVALLAQQAGKPAPWFEILLDRFAAHSELEQLVEQVLATGRDPELGRRALELVVSPEVRLRLLAALAAADHPDAESLLQTAMRDAGTPWRTARAAVVLLEALDRCDHARWLCDFVERYDEHDFSGDASPGIGNDFDALGEAMACHAVQCPTCKREWAVQLFRVARGLEDRQRLFVLARGLLQDLTGASTDDQLWAWLAAAPDTGQD